MKRAFRTSAGISNTNLEKLELVNEVIDEFSKQGYKLTLRQLYYQLVTKLIIPNEVAEYDKLGNLLVKGRMAGLVDWDAIEDRLRVPYIPYWVEGVNDALEDTINHYRLNRQKGQDVYIELWVEKDALSAILKRITQRYHIRLMVNRGYSSCTAMHDAYKRIRYHEELGEKAVILYLGDHDPSGLDMVRDINTRLNEFGVHPEVRQIGLTMEQIKKYNPPPNPAKIKDPRAKDYIAEYGEISWEVDALTPRILDELIETEVEGIIDIDLFDKMRVQEEMDKDVISSLIE